MSRAQDIRNITIIAEKLGFRLEGRTANDHLKWRHPSGALVVTGSDLPTKRHIRNARAQLRRGLQQAQTKQALERADEIKQAERRKPYYLPREKPEPQGDRWYDEADHKDFNSIIRSVK